MHPPEAERLPGTLVHRAPPRLKLIAAVLIVTLTALLPRHLDQLYLLPAAVLLSLWPLSRMPLRYGLRRLLVAEVFILGIALLTLVHPAGAPIFFSSMVKSNLCVLTMVLLTWTTPFHQLLQELRRWHFPTIMLTTLALMYRYLPVLGEETRRMSRARASRTFSRQRSATWHSLVLIIAQLFIRSTERAERIYLAMCSRGWK
jgi:cobalt/nickel transport system permease protein